MRIAPITYINPRRNQQMSMSRPNMTQKADVFIKQPAFRGNVFQYLQGEIAYTPKNIEKFKQIVAEMKLNNKTNNLPESWIETAKKMFSNLDNKNAEFCLDFLLSTGKRDSFYHLPFKRISELLPKIKFSQEQNACILHALDYLDFAWPNGVRHNFYMYKDALTYENIPFLKTLIVDNNWQGFKQYDMGKYEFVEYQLPIIRNGQRSDNPEIKELFNDKNIYNLLRQYENVIQNIIFRTVYGCGNEIFDLALLYHDQTQNSGERGKISERIAYCLWEYAYHNRAELLSNIPMTNFERKILDKNNDIQSIKDAMYKRIEKIITRNGANTADQLLDCLNDKVMSTEMLSQPYKNIRLINKIAELPVTEQNKETTSKIIAKLSEMQNIPDNDVFRNAALIAAKNGNAELLKFFDAKHIHYKNLISEPINSYPAEVRPLLQNAKRNSSEIFNYLVYPDYLNTYLEQHPDIDVNSHNAEGRTLALTAVQEKNLEMLKVLAKRDDVDWHMPDNKGENVITEILKYSYNNKETLKFKKQALQILKELPEERFNINHIYSTPNIDLESQYTALSFMFNKHITAEYQLLSDLLKFKNIDTNFDPQADTPLIYKTLDNTRNFEKIFQHPKTDKTLIYKPEFSQILRRNSNQEIASGVTDIINKYSDEQNVEWVKNIYDTNGSLELDEIEKFISYDRLKNIVNAKFNIVGENIAHLLVDIFVDKGNPGEIKRFADIFEKLKNAGFDFKAKDDLDRTPLDKAIEGENDLAISILRRYQ